MNKLIKQKNENSLLKVLAFVALGLCAQTVLAGKAHDAARRGDLDSLRKSRFEGIDLYLPDARGFTPYELAALHANPDKKGSVQRNVKLMLWLKEYNTKHHNYGKASGALIQAGLKALGYDAENPSGVLGAKTAKAIRAYQRDNKLAETGRPGPQWLGVFYQDTVKDLQQKLGKMGYKVGIDGEIGSSTKRAVKQFRRAKGLPSVAYPHVDAAIITAVNHQYNNKEDKRKENVVETEERTEKKQARYIQAGLSGLGYRIGGIDGHMGDKTKSSLKKFQKKNGLKVTGKLDKKTTKLFHKNLIKDTQKKLNGVGYSVGTADGFLGAKSVNALRDFRKKQGLKARGGIDADLMIRLQRKYKSVAAKREREVREDKRKAEALRKAEEKVERQQSKSRLRFAQAGMRTLGYGTKVDGHTGKKTEAGIKKFQKRYKLKQTGKVSDATYSKMKVIFLKETQRKLNALNYKNGTPDGKLGKGTMKAIKQFRKDKKLSRSGYLTTKLIVAVDDSYDNHSGKKAKKSNKSTKKSKKESKKSNKISARVVTTSRRSSSVGGRSARGRMTFNRSDGRVVGCTIKGRYIPIEWCEPFYPLPRNNYCKASFGSNGSVVNLWCK